MTELERLAAAHCRQAALTVRQSAEMPPGYETAMGVYDPDTQTLHLNPRLPGGAPRPDALFCLYHELRHAEQYQHPGRFPDAVRASLPYVILYNGLCFRQTGTGWRQCLLQGDEAFFTAAYLSLPHERDANEYACRRLTEEEGCASAAEELRRFWLPEAPLPPEQLETLYRQIDQATSP